MLHLYILFAVRTFKIKSLGNFEVYNTVFFTITSVLRVRPLGFIHLLVASLYVPFNNVSPISPLPAPSNYHFTHFLWVQLLQIPHINDIIQYLSSSVWFMSLRVIPSMSIHVIAWQDFFMSLCWTVFHIHIYTSSLSIHPLKTLRLFPPCGNCE